MHDVSLFELRQAIGVIWFIISTVLVGLFGWYLYEESRKATWWQRLANKLAVPLFVYILGGEIVRICIMIVDLFQGAAKETVGWVLLLVGGGFSILGAMGIIYILAPRHGFKIAMTLCAFCLLLLIIFHFTGVPPLFTK